jgi:hypothetical protein
MHTLNITKKQQLEFGIGCNALQMTSPFANR